MRSLDDLIYDLIFDERDSYTIDIAEYIDDIYRYDDFVMEMRKVLKKSKVKILESEVKLDSKTAIWILKVRK